VAIGIVEQELCVDLFKSLTTGLSQLFGYRNRRAGIIVVFLVAGSIKIDMVRRNTEQEIHVA